MANSNKPRLPRAGNNDGKANGEQVLSSVVALLFTAVICIGIGILIGRYQPGAKDKPAEDGAQVERLPGAEKTAKREASRQSRDTSQQPVVTEGVQISPAPVIMPGEPTGASAPASRQVSQREPNSQIVPAPPPRRKEEADVEKAPVPVTATETPAEPMPAATSDTGMPVSPVEDIKTQLPPTASPAQPEVSGPFTVQVGSFDTQANAERFKNSIESKSDYAVRLYPAKDDGVVKACIGSYKTKETATQVRDELLRINDFKGCFVKAVSEL
ncbi:MAG: SPOR domain-containing protein [Candidatus Hydrogenedentes bacterium]|nr:SPOR domain-containing protein [Candidatus Hydrogenedentota bacterium]